MSNLMNEFENRFTNEFFSCGWSDVEAKAVEAPKVEVSRKDLLTLQAELASIQENIEKIAQKKLVLANMAKLYES